MKWRKYSFCIEHNSTLHPKLISQPCWYATLCIPSNCFVAFFCVGNITTDKVETKTSYVGGGGAGNWMRPWLWHLIQQKLVPKISQTENLIIATTWIIYVWKIMVSKNTNCQNLPQCTKGAEKNQKWHCISSQCGTKHHLFFTWVPVTFCCERVNAELQTRKNASRLIFHTKNDNFHILTLLCCKAGLAPEATQ